ncbi:MAG: 3-hydroxybutyryl-CoA dehydratase [uncultured Thermomicrobiales bacterium]|uniref:3-hydroxybutyryl-CoA dehydratase n=1 Tax=uncultured Thermomicrobiales bacterium TaxID=1645740 RepID=A0A6J4UGC3_9BACT|nr:MAG: 3-hydroxybutyryl-CoA dehydratase [uncultured Thermomicrobiales bacterium]
MSIDLERDGHVGVITINQPGVLNALNSERLHELLATVREASNNPSMRVIVLTGAGDRAFAAGADIREMAGLSRDEALAFGRLGHATALALETAPQPVIAAVNGFALGGGCELALACDIRYAAENAVFAQPEVGLGIPPGWGATQRLPRLVNPSVAAEMIFTGKRVDAGEALRLGLVNAVFPADVLMERTFDLARMIAAQAPEAVRAAKRLIAISRTNHSNQSHSEEMRTFAEAFGGFEQQEGMRAFLDKRPAVFGDGFTS